MFQRQGPILGRPQIHRSTSTNTFTWGVVGYLNFRNKLLKKIDSFAHCLNSITIYMLHYNPQHVSSSTLLIFRRTNCIIAASGIVTLCERSYSMPVESGLSPIPDAVIIQFVLLKMSKVLSETCRGL